MTLGEKPSRLGIFFLFDAEGQVDTYVGRLLEGMKSNLGELVVVVDGALDDEGCHRFKNFVDQLITRENTGPDVRAYKTTLDAYGWECFVEFGELVLLNATTMGPVHPLEEVFDEMAGCNPDFWDITGLHAVDEDSDLSVEEVRIPAHIQPHFHVYRYSPVELEPFQSYWNETLETRDY